MKNKVLKISLIIAGSLIVLFFLSWFLLQKILRDEINAKLDSGLIPGHKVKMDNIETDLLSASVTASDIYIVPDEKPAEKMQGFRIDSCYISSISIKGISAIRYLLFKSISIGELEIGKAYLKLSLSSPDSSIKKKDDKSRLKAAVLKKLKIDDLQLLLMEMNSEREILSVNRFHLQTKKIRLVSKNGKAVLSRYPHIEAFEIDTLSSVISGGFYRIEIGQMLKKEDRNFEINRLKLLPQYPRYTFAKKLGYQTDRIKLLLDRLMIRGFDFEKLEDNILQCRSIETNGMFADFFRDKNIPRPPGHRPPLPQQTITALDFKLCIDSISLNNNEVHYTEHMPGAAEAGFVFFRDLNVLAMNLTNDPDYFNRSSTVQAFATGSVMGESLARIKISFPANKTPDTLFFSGQLEPMKLDHFNSMLERNQEVRINEGSLDKLSFEARANNDVASGKLEFLYHDLNITVMKKEEEGSKERKFISFLMNTILRSNNPVGNKEPLVAEMSFERDKEKSFINYMWKTILSGITETITPGKKKLERKE
ncbi:MAG: hypothetical protein U5Q03_06555 [Bacteroidota bacterium]|nr:hypothetical protein [Bacteroidota bacterium]